MKDIKIYVTQEHIDKSEQYNPEKCMVANAMYDAGFEYVAVSYVGIDLFVQDNLYDIEATRMPIDDEIKKAIIEFDNYKVVKPFNFIIKNVDEKYLVIK